ncbi:THAP domain-containing protein 5 isoform X2 [Hemicordylus capensis]|uniref:THAP domain-containing protein 5 isoform X2 n=1 Tax=Hemicordylus capensis TaxID=884348 RepID=UPI0023047E20|nr:THAP domain-containing protein 5 isoform X2 [Hemicordylus capensis]
MPRYCAAACCRNRAGQSARDQRKLSFYPFPLHDKERLEKWLRNMRRDTWTPSKHQVLCSDHFTPDSLDVRWGIRYLKTTAVPTIFSSSDNQEKRLSQKNKQEKRIEDIKERSKSTAATSPKSCSPKINIVIEESLYRKALSTTLSRSPEKKAVLQNTEKNEDDIACPNRSSGQHREKISTGLTAADMQNATLCDSTPPENSSFNHSVESLFSSATTLLQASIHELHSRLECDTDSKATVLQATDLEHLESSLEFNNVTVPMNDFPPDLLNSHITGCSVEVQDTDENSVLLQTVTQALEQFNGNKESVITIIVPSESSDDPFLLEGAFVTAERELVNIEAERSACIATYGGTEVLQTEHSYCRQDIDREQLWQKITKLHAKIALLEVQERKTLSRLKTLEALIAKLKQENLLSEEKLKIVENCFTTFEVTMIQ